MAAREVEVIELGNNISLLLLNGADILRVIIDDGTKASVGA